MTREPDDYVIGRIQDALAHDPSLGELDVNVSIRAGRVYLTGVVATPERQARIAEIAAATARDLDVCNETVVSTMAEDPEPERLS